MKDNVMITQCRNRLRDDCQLRYCRVQINNASISKINKVGMFFSPLPVLFRLNFL